VLEAGTTITSEVAQQQMSEMTRMNVPVNTIYHPSFFQQFMQWSTPSNTVSFQQVTSKEMSDNLKISNRRLLSFFF